MFLFTYKGLAKSTGKGFENSIINQATYSRMDSNNETGSFDAEESALNRFLQQQRNDLMFELRRIRLGDRPVTGQNHRENIANFVAKYVQDPTHSSQSNKETIPANVDAVEQHRPEAVIVEVQGVFEQHRVSTVLQSANFRRHLENIIRDSISAAHQTLTTSSRGRSLNSPQPSTQIQSSPADEDGNRSSSISEHISAVPITVNQLPPQESVPPLVNMVQQHLPAHLELPVDMDVSERQLWTTVSQVQHEEMVYEISDLVHRRLVSTALGSEFRGVMELHVQNHLRHTQTNGEAVADFIRSIPQSHLHMPNDFSHLGLINGPRDDNSDSISITGLSATAVPYAQTNMHLNREVQNLKAQMEEMKNMLRLSFDLQLDIQRAIRQEVAAAFATISAQGAMAFADIPVIRSIPVSDTHCLICLENHSDSVLYQCGHMCVCFACGKNLITQGNAKCPVCRAPIRDIIRAYKTNVE